MGVSVKPHPDPLLKEREINVCAVAQGVWGLGLCGLFEPHPRPLLRRGRSMSARSRRGNVGFGWLGIYEGGDL